MRCFLFSDILSGMKAVQLTVWRIAKLTLGTVVGMVIFAILLLIVFVIWSL